MKMHWPVPVHDLGIKQGPSPHRNMGLALKNTYSNAEIKP
jgi:hypothetical protein